MSTKIIEWSRPRIHLQAPGRHSIRWKAALAAYSPDRLRAYTVAATRATLEAAAATRAMPAGTDTKKATWWRRPRRRGFESPCSCSKRRLTYHGPWQRGRGPPSIEATTGGGRAAVLHVGGTHDRIRPGGPDRRQPVPVLHLAGPDGGHLLLPPDPAPAAAGPA